jgi:hypothetical protein
MSSPVLAAIHAFYYPPQYETWVAGVLIDWRVGF